jgi:hypothetical protein
MANANKTGLFALSLLTLALWLLPFTSQAVVLDWDSVNYSSGSFSQSFDIDSSNPGNDVTITITGNTSYFAQNVNDNSNLAGGYSPTQQSLFMNMNYDTRNQFITVTVTFNYAQGVQDVSFSIFDIDKSTAGNNSGYTDKIVLLGKNLNGTLVAPTTITTHSANETVGSGTNIYVRGTASANDSGGTGNADYTFSGTNTLASFSFTYGNDSNAPNDPGNQWISLFDITYKPRVPEWHPGLIASFACMMMVGVRRFFF